PLCILDADTPLTLAHIDDVTGEMIRALEGRATRQGAFCALSRTFPTTVGEVAQRIVSFRTERPNCAVPDMDDPLTMRLYSTYLSYLPEDGFGYPLTLHEDDRGLFAEFLKSPSGGQVSVNISRPGVTKGNHYHHLKVEKILVVSGEGIVRLQMLGGGPVLEYRICGNRPSVVTIPPGYVHTVENTGGGDMAMVIWANQVFDPERPDTYPAQIQL
ncbi:MAG: capsular polysaccharide biosynthesis protein CapF, partial [Bacillota bacterium]